MKVNNSTFDNSDYDPGHGFFIRTIWYYVNVLIFKSYIFPFYGMKSLILRLFGASVGSGLVIKPNINIKYPWFLSIGNNVWLGEGSWIDNLSMVEIGDNVCISQGALILTGNHNYTKQTFDLVTKKIIIKDGVWIGAKAIVCPGVICESHSVLSVGSIATNNLQAYTVYSGIPAEPIRERKIS